MRLFSRSRGDYALIKSESPTSETGDIPPSPPSPRRRTIFHAWILLLIAATCFILGFASGYLPAISIQGGLRQQDTSVSCKDPPIRREWRMLSDDERADYTRAIWCLKTIPSRVGANWTLYDDFPWVHAMVGRYSHDSAAFLAWHRYFIHIYEQALQQECGYRGHLAYWNWSLDSPSLPSSPIFSPTHGFGSNSLLPSENQSHLDPNFSGFCVTDGPLANLQILHIGADYKPHCLSRNLHSDLYSNDTTDADRVREMLNPEALEKVLEKESYRGFNQGLEDGPHLAVPLKVKGDFLFLTAPSDPVFILHHTQLDRLWWMWQQRDLEKRLREYTGPAAAESEMEASLEDVIPLGDLAPEVKVKDIMSTEGELLCYRY